MESSSEEQGEKWGREQLHNKQENSIEKIETKPKKKSAKRPNKKDKKKKSKSSLIDSDTTLPTKQTLFNKEKQEELLPLKVTSERRQYHQSAEDEIESARFTLPPKTWAPLQVDGFDGNSVEEEIQIQAKKQSRTNDTLDARPVWSKGSDKTSNRTKDKERLENRKSGRNQLVERETFVLAETGDIVTDGCESKPDKLVVDQRSKAVKLGIGKDESYQKSRSIKPTVRPGAIAVSDVGIQEFETGKSSKLGSKIKHKTKNEGSSSRKSRRKQGAEGRTSTLLVSSKRDKLEANRSTSTRSQIGKDESYHKSRTFEPSVRPGAVAVSDLGIQKLDKQKSAKANSSKTSDMGVYRRWMRRGRRKQKRRAGEHVVDDGFSLVGGGVEGNTMNFRGDGINSNVVIPGSTVISAATNGHAPAACILAINNEDQTSTFEEEPGEVKTINEQRSSQSHGHWCDICRRQQTHKKEHYGPFGFLSRLKPQTVEGFVYKGHCLCCHNAFDLRQLLNDPSIPLDLFRLDPDIDVTAAVQPLSGSLEMQDGLFPMPTRKRSPLERLCSSIKFQATCLLFFLVVVGASIAAGVTIGQSGEPWVAPPPTAAPSQAPSNLSPSTSPTPFGNNLVMTITKDEVESFGYSVKMNRDGTIMAVSSPRYDGSRGRLDIFRIDQVNWQPIGEPLVGDLTSDELGIGMHLSGDGTTVAVGLPGNSAGMVKVFTIDPDVGLVQKGQSLTGPSPLSQFGYSVSLSVDGSRLIVGAPQFGDDPIDLYGIVQTYEFDGTAWVALARDIIGETIGSRFGNSVVITDLGNRIAVGAPLDNSVGEDAGRIVVFDLVDDTWVELNTGFDLYGTRAGSQLGKKVAIYCIGTLVATGDHDPAFEKFPNAGVVKSWSINLLEPDLGSAYVGLEHDGAKFVENPIVGDYEGARIGHDLQLDCNGDSGVATVAVTSSENRNGRAGTTRYALLADKNDLPSGSKLQVYVEAFGPELGTTPWLGKGPSVAIADMGYRIAVGYESVRYNGRSRSEVRIYDHNVDWYSA